MVWGGSEAATFCTYIRKFIHKHIYSCIHFQRAKWSEGEAKQQHSEMMEEQQVRVYVCVGVCVFVCFCVFVCMHVPTFRNDRRTTSMFVCVCVCARARMHVSMMCAAATFRNDGRTTSMWVWVYVSVCLYACMCLWCAQLQHSEMIEEQLVCVCVCLSVCVLRVRANICKDIHTIRKHTEICVHARSFKIYICMPAYMQTTYAYTYTHIHNVYVCFGTTDWNMHHSYIHAK